MTTLDFFPAPDHKHEEFWYDEQNSLLNISILSVSSIFLLKSMKPVAL